MKFVGFTISGGVTPRLPKGGQRHSVKHARLIDFIGGDFYGD